MDDKLCLLGAVASLPIYFIPSFIFTSIAVHLPWVELCRMHNSFLFIGTFSISSSSWKSILGALC